MSEARDAGTDEGNIGEQGIIIRLEERAVNNNHTISRPDLRGSQWSLISETSNIISTVIRNNPQPILNKESEELSATSESTTTKTTISSHDSAHTADAE